VKKLIEQLFCIKIIPARKYDELTSRITECGLIYRKYSQPDYHTVNRTVEIKLSELSHICTVENILWDDVKLKFDKL
jgi:hypothetical protein